MAEPTDDKKSEHGAGMGYAAGTPDVPHGLVGVGSKFPAEAAEVEAVVTDALGKLSADRPASQSDIRARIDRVTIGDSAIQVGLSADAEGDDSARSLTLRWTPPSPYRRREIIQGATADRPCR